MIRHYISEDIPAVLEIWLLASIEAHHFIPETFWEGKLQEMEKVYIPKSITYVYQDLERQKVIGFISLVGNFIAALFVSPQQQGEGVGTTLLEFVKKKFSKLELTVYCKNNSAVQFYKKRGFQIIQESIDENTKQQEYTMQYLP